jgi:hypothetical protein
MFEKLKFWKKREEEDMPEFKEEKFPGLGRDEEVLGSEERRLGITEPFKEPGMEEKAPMPGMEKPVEGEKLPGELSLRGEEFGREIPPERPGLKPAPLETAAVPPHEVSMDRVLKNVELVGAKVDALRAHIETLGHKVEALEKLFEDVKKRGW